jgi:hypothetical protein
MRNHSARALIVVLLALSNTSCMKWSFKGPTPQAAIRNMSAGQRLRVTNADGSQLMMTRSQIRGDSLSYMEAGKLSSRPFSQVTAVHIQTINLPRTFGLISVGAGVLAAYVLKSFGDSFER